MDATLKIIQMVRFGMLASIVLYLLIGETVLHKPTGVPGSASSVFYFAIALAAILLIGMLLFVRQVFVLRSEAVLAAESENSAALMRWRAGYIITYAMSEAVALFGLVLRAIGFALLQVAPFYVAGFVLMLLFSPRRPSNTIG